MLEAPESIDDEPWRPGDTRARFFTRCEPCDTLFTSLNETNLLIFAHAHAVEHALNAAHGPELPAGARLAFDQRPLRSRTAS